MKLLAWLLCLTGPAYVVPLIAYRGLGPGYCALAVQMLGLLGTLLPERRRTERWTSKPCTKHAS